MSDTLHYKVCARCFTYNQAAYIEDCLIGLSCQHTSFPYVCVIMDDNSTDETQAVINNFLDNHFEEVGSPEETNDFSLRVLRHRENRNCFFLVFFLKYNHYSIAKPRVHYFEERIKDYDYVAYCEGDDYWSSPLKLQKQVGYMESHKGCGFVHSRAKVYNQRTKRLRVHSIGKPIESFESLIMNNDICTLTTCFRKDLSDQYFKESQTWEERKNWLMGDYPEWLWIYQHTDMGFINEDLCVYRELQESASHTKDMKKQIAFVESGKSIRLFFAKKYGCDQTLLEEIEFRFLRSLYSIYKSNNMKEDANEVFSRIDAKGQKKIMKDEKKSRIYGFLQKLLIH